MATLVKAKRPKLRFGYDNIEDAKNKLKNCYATYKGKPIIIKEVNYMPGTDPDKNVFGWFGHTLSGRKLADSYIALDDPEFNASEYNLGYLNNHGFASWFYRVPFRQYHQGLRSDQVGQYSSNPAYHMDFKPCTQLGLMLENRYPSFGECADVLKKEDVALVAFNRNFAMAYDRIHRDFILEYKGHQIGYTPNLEDFKLLTEHEHLYEALKEAIG